MRVCFVASEVFPFSKTGGLADVAGALPVALSKHGTDIVVFSPAYRSAKAFKLQKLGKYNLSFGSKEESYELLTKSHKGIRFYFIGNDYYYDREFLYNDGLSDYEDNAERFSLFCAATLDALSRLKLQPEIIHINDWQTALIPAYKKLYFPQLSNAKVLLTIHNIAYQGIFNPDKLSALALPNEYFSIKLFEFYGKLNLLKGGIVLSDFINTVSKTYAEEIQTEEFGAGLHGVLKSVSYKLTGIVNGIDTEYWNPETDQMIFYNYSQKKIENKEKNKTALRKLLGLTGELPMFGMVSRMATQKGLDILIPAVNLFLKQNRAHFVFLGKGDKPIENSLKELSEKYKDTVSANIRFDETLAHRIYAASDFFLMPSRYEPCGLGQLIAYRYGTIPIARATGGLKDTINDLNDQGNGTGFLFEEYSDKAFLDKLHQAYKLYDNQGSMLNIRKHIMSLDYSWENQSKEYMKLYERIISLA